MFTWFTNWMNSWFGHRPNSSSSSSSSRINSSSSTNSSSSSAAAPVVPVTPGRNPVKKALLVGINYTGTSNQLNGCINDVLLVNQIIRQYWTGIENSNIRMLTDESATTANMIERLKWLVDGAQAGDVLLYHFSGHGVQIACNNYETHQEIDSLDECEVPWDFDWRKNVIRDEDLKRIFANVPSGVNLTVISDSCHSGSLLREMVNPMIQPSASPNRIKTILVPPDINNRAYGINLKPKSREIRNINNDQIGILISGCKDTQTSADIWVQKANKYHGALTYYFSEVLKENNYNVTYANAVIDVNKKLASNGYDQEPQLDCADGMQNKIFLQSLV